MFLHVFKDYKDFKTKVYTAIFTKMSKVTKNFFSVFIYFAA